MLFQKSERPWLRAHLCNRNKEKVKKTPRQWTTGSSGRQARQTRLGRLGKPGKQAGGGVGKGGDWPRRGVRSADILDEWSVSLVSVCKKCCVQYV